VGPGAGKDKVEKRKILPLKGIEPQSISPWPVAIQTELYRLHNKIQHNNNNNNSNY
jgi:hypothetical protein